MTLIGGGSKAHWASDPSVSASMFPPSYSMPGFPSVFLLSYAEDADARRETRTLPRP